MFILGTICARGGSKGIPHKNIKRLGGKPLIVHTLECSLKCADLNEIVVSTDDKQIAAIAREYDFPVLQRPPELATDTASKWDVFRQIAGIYHPDILVDLDTGCPFRSPEDISGCIQLLNTSEDDLFYGVVMTAYEAERSPFFNMVVKRGFFNPAYCVVDGDIEKPITRRQDAPPVYSLSPSVVAIQASNLKMYNHWSQCRLGIYTVPRSRALDIDTEDDWTYAEYLIGRK